MPKHVKSYHSGDYASLLSLTALILLLSIQACTPSQKNVSGNKNEETRQEKFHADHDIAMTVRSLADAIRVGEPLDSVDYDFQGILTDGQGSPLYTDVQGNPGEWLIDVLDTTNVTIKNLYLGDLLPDDLRNYILTSLKIEEENRIPFESEIATNDDETDILVYSFKGGFIRFEIRAGIAPNGLEGPYLTIVLSAIPPEGAETQKVA